VLELRPICENCAKDLPPAATDAMICTFECTFCRDCALDLLGNVCPNCGGGFSPRPIRPVTNWNGDNHLGAHPPSAARHHRPVDLEAHRLLRARIGERPPGSR
jgi:hypothetical protein